MLGDTRARALDLLEFETGGEIQTDECGDEYIAVDTKSRPQGNFSIRFENSIVCQIESGTSRYHAAGWLVGGLHELADGLEEGGYFFVVSFDFLLQFD